MKQRDILYEDFQNQVNNLLSRHRSILDILSKTSTSNASINRAVTKSITSCGCVEIDAKKAHIPDDITLEEMKNYMDSHLRGELCSVCRDNIEKELGNHLFYIAALANTLDISLYDILVKEEHNLSVLGKFHLK
jgi:hypothetical protein